MNEFLYQYTSLEVLALILQGKKIKFSQLSTLDDPREKYVPTLYVNNDKLEVKDVKYGDFCFVSCWTGEQSESIAMWDMYGDRKRGVRIGLPSNMLDPNFTLIKNNNAQADSSTTHPSTEVPELISIDYNHVVLQSMTDSEIYLNANDLGKNKAPDWRFQKEKRFRLFAEYDEDIKQDKYALSATSDILKGFKMMKPVSNTEIYWGLTERAISQIQIIYGPNMTNGQIILLDSLIQKYNINKDNVKPSQFIDKHKSNQLTIPLLGV